jgi:CubicO group peptidase (beta-lactamase class C family)
MISNIQKTGSERIWLLHAPQLPGWRVFTVTIITVCSLISQFACLPVHADTKLNPAFVEKIDKLFGAYDGNDRPGASIAMVKDGEIAYQQGYGMANLEYDVPNTPRTVFHVASVSKQFTCFAILLLVQDGKLSLDDDIRDHVQWFPDLGYKITLRHLMYHTSGIRDQWTLMEMSEIRMDDVINMAHLRRFLARQRELNFAPGNEFLYCNSGFTLLTDVVSRVSGKSSPFVVYERKQAPTQRNMDRV